MEDNALSETDAQKVADSTSMAARTAATQSCLFVSGVSPSSLKGLEP